MRATGQVHVSWPNANTGHPDVARQPGLSTVCAETTYHGVYDGTLGLNAAACLRSRRPRRKKRRTAASSRASVLRPTVVPISERPDEASERAPGHWEEDLIIGTRYQSASLPLVERSPGFQLVHTLPTNGYLTDLLIATPVR